MSFFSSHLAVCFSLIMLMHAALCWFGWSSQAFVYAVSTETCSLISYGEVHYTTHHRILLGFVVCRRFSCLEGIGSTRILCVTAVHSTGTYSSSPSCGSTSRAKGAWRWARSWPPNSLRLLPSAKVVGRRCDAGPGDEGAEWVVQQCGARIVLFCS